MAENNYLRQLREDKGLSIEDVAKLMGMAYATLSRLERGLQSARHVTIRTLAEYYGVTTKAMRDGLNGVTEAA